MAQRRIAAPHVVASTGFNTTATGYGFPVPSQRTVAQFAVWTPGTFDIDSAFASLSGFDKNGASGTLDGTDACAGTGALNHIGSLQRIKNGWTDTWSSY